MRERSIATPPRSAATWPSSEVPAPNGIIGSAVARRRSATSALTSSVELG